MKILDLFAGIGGFSLAAHWAGWETAAFVEWDKFCQRVLQKNFPNVPIYGDIKDFHYEQEREKIGPVDLICGGFPCQPFSHAGKRNGTTDDRYLWPEMLRVVREVKPSWVVGENVAGLLSMDGGAVFESVCASLEDEGYTVEAFVIPAIAVGAPHRRDRVWIIAHAECGRQQGSRQQRFGIDIKKDCKGETDRVICHYFAQGATPRPESPKREPSGGTRARRKGFTDGNSQSLLVGNPNKQGLEGRRGFVEHANELFIGSANWGEHWYEVATRICRMDDGIPRRVDRSKRLKALGNAIVPQVAYEIFRVIQTAIDEQ